MGFHVFRGLVRPPPAIHAEPHYKDLSLVMRVHSNCPFSYDELPDVPTIPPPVLPGQMMTFTFRDGWGRALEARQMVAVDAGCGLAWAVLRREKSSHSYWSSVVLFPNR